MISKDIPGSGAAGEMLFNMECGNFAGVGSVQTRYDRQLDAESDTEGQLLEKMISGRYLGEIVRLIIAHRSSQGESFRGWMAENSVFRRALCIHDRACFGHRQRHFIQNLSPQVDAASVSLGVPEAALKDERRRSPGNLRRCGQKVGAAGGDGHCRDGDLCRSRPRARAPGCRRWKPV